jgi:hypothetical protein
MTDRYASHMEGLTSPIIGGFAIMPSDSEDLPETTRQIRVSGMGGEIAVVWAAGVETTEPVSTGDVLDWRVVRVKATGTTATGLRGYY